MLITKTINIILKYILDPIILFHARNKIYTKQNDNIDSSILM